MAAARAGPREPQHLRAGVVLTDDSHTLRVRRATVFLLKQLRQLEELFLPDAEESQRGAKAVLLNADALGSVLATVYGTLRGDPEIAAQWLAEVLRIFEAAVQGEYDPTFVLDMAAIRKVQTELLDWGKTLDDAAVPDTLPDDL